MEKLGDVLKAVRECLEAGRVRDTRHATIRKSERLITFMEIVFVLKNGFHEKRKDQWDDLYQAWNYAIRGKTVDRRNLRVIVSFEAETGMLIITAIDLDR